MIKAFIPLAGPRAGLTYTLPPVLFTNFSVAAEIDKQIVDFTELAEASGSWTGTGYSPAYSADTVYSIESILSEGWRISQGYEAGIGGLYTARADFIQCVVQGGMGTLTMGFAAGYFITNPWGHQVQITSGLASVKMIGNHTESWLNDGELKINYTFQSLSGCVTLRPGNVILAV